MLHIQTVSQQKRMPTRELLQKIATAVAQGETDFQISASGQHDIGSAIWNRDGKNINLRIWNPGQRVGGMCLPGTRITVEGPAPADAGWLNSGGEIIIKGDAGDTAGHCAASGYIYIGGRAGTRTGALMKHDPMHSPPELWILGHTGSFSFEFMGGGTAVVCGYNSLDLPSILGERPGVGMVGGIIYFRGNIPQLPVEVAHEELDDTDMDFLDSGLSRFLNALGKPELKKELSIWKHWHKLIPAGNMTPASISIQQFHVQHWIETGLFCDIYKDDQEVVPLVPYGDNRLHFPEFARPDACTDCRLCLTNCPNAAMQRRKANLQVQYKAKSEKCSGCGICAAVCPGNVWDMVTNNLP